MTNSERVKKDPTFMILQKDLDHCESQIKRCEYASLPELAKMYKERFKESQRLSDDRLAIIMATW